MNAARNGNGEQTANISRKPLAKTASVKDEVDAALAPTLWWYAAVIALAVAGIFSATEDASAHTTKPLSAHAPPAQVAHIICEVFGPRFCRQALRVAQCESTFRTRSWTTGTHARNGQHLGIFQMGRRERATYGHGPGVWKQARSARSYFIASGRDWSPWECKP